MMQYDIFISYKLKKILPTQNCWHCFNVVYHKSSLGVPLVLFGLFYRALKWIRSVFKEGMNTMQIYAIIEHKFIGQRSRFRCYTYSANVEWPEQK